MLYRRHFFLLYALIIALSTFSGVFYIGSIVYIASVIGFLVISVISGHLKFGLLGLLGFVMICVLSILVNNPPSYFRVWERLAFFVCTLLAFSPIIVSSRINTNRVLLFDSLMMVMMLFSVASFVGYFFGINFFLRGGVILDFTEAGHFSGFTNHSMNLAPISAMGGLYGITKALFSKKKDMFLYFWWGMTLMCFGSVLLSASRGALGGVVFAVVIIIYKRNAGHIDKFMRYGLSVIAALAISFPLWGGLTDSVIKKNNYNISEGGIMYSREEKMAARLYEIRNNPLTGVGFSTVDETVDYVDRSTGTVEPNSSWLGVFSMTGIFGFLIFLSIYVYAFINANKKIPDKQVSTLLCAIWGFFFVHMMIEGYILAGGNYLCGTYWLTLGVIFAYSNHKSERLIV